MKQKHTLLGSVSLYAMQVGLTAAAKAKMEADPDYQADREQRIKDRYRFIFLDRPYRPMFG